MPTAPGKAQALDGPDSPQNGRKFLSGLRFVPNFGRLTLAGLVAT
jgi:hypothetical protein